MRRAPIRYGRVLEQHTDWLWTVIEPLEPDGAVSDTGADG